MKVAHVIISGEVAGGQMVCGQIIEALKKRGDEVLVVSPTAGAFTERLKQNNVSIYFIPFDKTYHFQNAFRLWRILKKERVDLVHTHGMVPMNVQARLASKWAGVPCISHIHIANVFNPNPIVRRYQMFLDNWTSGFSSKLIAVSQATRQSLVRQGIAGERIEVIPNGVRENGTVHMSKEEVFKKLGISENHSLIGMVGRLCPTKGQEEFLKSVAEVSRAIPNVIGVIIGKDTEFNGTYERRLRAISHELGLSKRVLFLGYQEDPRPYIHAMDFLILPSKVEGMPLVILEAMALKRAVVAHQVDGVSEVVEDGITGILVSPNAPQTLTLSIVKLLQNPSLSKKMGEAGFEKMRQFYSESRMSARVLELYDELLSRGK